EYGIGWALRHVGGATIVEHGGSTNGFQARLLLVPDRNFALAILTNSSRASALYREVTRVALETFLGLREELPTFISLPVDQLARLAGTYRTLESDITVTVEDSSLRRKVHTHDSLDDTEKD